MLLCYKKPTSVVNEFPKQLKGFSLLQKRAILDPAPVKQIIAGAGSGKTRTIIGLLDYRLRSGLEDCSSVLMLSFSRKAVAELKERLPLPFRNQISIQTFHGFCLKALQSFYPHKSLKILQPEKRQRFYQRYLSRALEIGGIPIPLLEENPESFREMFPELFERLEKAFQKYKHKYKFLEFSDLIDNFLILLREQSHHPKIHEIIHRYQCIIVDEFQDTDPRQFEFLCLMRSPRIIIVGDDWQAIYAFRGATVEPFMMFRKQFSAKVFYLTENYRSLQQVVHLGMHVIKQSSRQLKKNVQVVRNSTQFPNFAIPMHQHIRAEFLNMLDKIQNYMFLVRSNQRRIYWENNGIAKDRILTIHRSKGLEFPIVFLDICGGWGTLPVTVNDEQKNYEDEEIRVLYVGITRAQNLLTFLYLPSYRKRSRDGYFWNVLLKKKLRCLDQLPLSNNFQSILKQADTLN